MSDAIYEVLFRGAPDGTMSGAHVIYWQFDGTDRNGVPRYSPGMPEPIDPAAVADLLGPNVAAMAAQITGQQAEIDALKSEIEALKASQSAK
jgi:hypothetical protein